MSFNLLSFPSYISFIIHPISYFIINFFHHSFSSCISSLVIILHATGASQAGVCPVVQCKGPDIWQRAGTPMLELLVVVVALLPVATGVLVIPSNHLSSKALQMRTHTIQLLVFRSSGSSLWKFHKCCRKVDEDAHTLCLADMTTIFQ